MLKRYIRKAASYVYGKSVAQKKDLRTRYPQFEIGEGSYGGLEVFSFSESDRLSVGKYCSIAKNVRVLLGGEHRTDWITTFPFPATKADLGLAGHPVSKGEVTIGNDVWIGMGAMILSGVRIGDGAVVSAGALVSKNVEPYSIVAGNPARTVRVRFGEDQVRALLRIRWWDWPVAKIESELPELCSDAIDDFIRRHDTQ